MRASEELWKAGATSKVWLLRRCDVGRTGSSVRGLRQQSPRHRAGVPVSPISSRVPSLLLHLEHSQGLCTFISLHSHNAHTLRVFATLLRRSLHLSQHRLAMGKEKSKGGVANKHLHARIAYLQQAASYLTLQGKEHQIRGANAPQSTLTAPDDQTQHQNQPPIVDTRNAVNEAATHEQSPQQHSLRSGVELPETGGLPIHLATHLRQVALKSQIRLRTDVKHSICKRCSSVLVEGQTSNKRIENKSKGGKKPHADVLVISCKVCGAEKRFPVGAKRQKRKGERKQPDSGVDPSSVTLETKTEEGGG